MKRLRLLSFLWVFIIASVVSGQMYRWSGDSLPTNVFGRHYLTLGVSWVDVDELSERLNQLGLTGFSDYGLALGYGCDLVYDRMISGGEVEAILWRNNVTAGIRNKLWAGRLLFNAGYQMLNSDRFFFYPVIGLGAGVTSLWVGPEQIPFDSVFVAPSFSSDHVYHLSLIVNLGIGFDIIRASHFGGKYTVFGIRGGYMLDPIRSKRWYRNGTEITDSPDLNLQGPYIRVVMGKALGWESRRVKRMRMRKP